MVLKPPKSRLGCLVVLCEAYLYGANSRLVTDEAAAEIASDLARWRPRAPPMGQSHTAVAYGDDGPGAPCASGSEAVSAVIWGLFFSAVGRYARLLEAAPTLSGFGAARAAHQR